MKLSGWGNYPRIECRGQSFETVSELRKMFAEALETIPRGMGKSYGDSALADHVIFTRRFNKMLDFDRETGILTCESGATLSAVLDIFLPEGWFLSITPGVKSISVGGAVAADVHGKNHHRAGCFSECVIFLDLMLPDGRIMRCSRSENQDLFRATCGGMGLTGMILNAAIKLQPVASSSIDETIVRCSNLDAIFDAFDQYDKTAYSVAWIDCLAGGSRMGRSILMAGDHSNSGPLDPPRAPGLSVPFDLPGLCLNTWSVKLFNELYYRKSPSRPEHRVVSIDSFFYPLDGIGRWNRLYGKNGFTQYQLILPPEAGKKGLRRILHRIAESGAGSFLAVLKLMGPQNNNLLSFPMAGYTLALDFKIEKKLFPLLDELDNIVIDHGGRLYPAKDVRMTRSVFQKGYPKWKRFVQLREKYGLSNKINSLQSKRLGI